MNQRNNSSTYKYSPLQSIDDHNDDDSGNNENEESSWSLAAERGIINRWRKFVPSPTPEEKQGILLAFFLSIIGIAVCIVGLCVLFGVIEMKEWERGYAFFFLGFIPGLPGLYHLWIAYWAWRGAPGYSYSQIPVLQ